MESSTDLGQVFKTHDKSKQGRLNYIQFSYILNEICKINQDDITTIIKYLDPDNSKNINYVEFLSALFDGDYFSDNKHKEVSGIF